MEEREINKSVGKTVKVLCGTCKNKTKHTVLASLDIDGKEDYDGGFWYYWTNQFQIIECQGCGNVSFRNENCNSEDYDEDGPVTNELIYPKRDANTWVGKDFLNVPYNIRRIYRETIDCYNNDNLTLCGAGIRALVEGICQANDIADGNVEFTLNDGTIITKKQDNLQGKINGLFEAGKLTKENAIILHEHRFLGNTAIHDLSSPTKEELNLAIQILEHIFDSLYEIPQKGYQLRSKRIQKEANSKRFTTKGI